MIKHSLLTSLTTVLVIVFGVVSQFFLAKYLTKAEYGTYQLMWSWLQLFGFVALNSFNFVVIKAAAQKYPQFFRTANLFCLLSTLAGSAIFVIIGLFFRPALQELFFLLAAFFPLHSGINLSTAYYKGVSKFGKYAIFTILLQFFISGLQIGVLLLYQSVFWAIFVSLVVTSVFNLAFTVSIVFGLKGKQDKKKNKKLSIYGLQLAVMQMIPAISNRLQYIILEFLTSPVVLSVYAVAQLFPNQVQKVMQNFFLPFRVYLGGRSPEQGNKIILRALPLLFMFCLVAVLLIALFLPIAIYLIFGAKYEASIHYSILLIFSMLFFPLNVIINNYLLFHDFKKSFVVLMGSFSVFQIVLFFSLIPVFEIYGVIIAVLLSRFLLSAAQIFWLRGLPKNQEPKTLIVSPESKADTENRLYIKPKIQGKNILKIIEADYFSAVAQQPFWVRFVAKMSYTKGV